MIVHYGKYPIVHISQGRPPVFTMADVKFVRGSEGYQELSDAVPVVEGIAIMEGCMPLACASRLCVRDTRVPFPFRQLGIDAVPLIDAQTAGVEHFPAPFHQMHATGGSILHAGILGQVNSFTVVQRPSLTEAMGCCERSNIYDVFDAQTGGL